MFCKWCGNTIRSTDVKCPSCGRETPALSDCGGFYDLKHTPAQAAAQPPVIKPAGPDLAKLEGRFKKELQATSKITLLALILSIVAILLCLVLAFFVLRLSDQLDHAPTIPAVTVPEIPEDPDDPTDIPEISEPDDTTAPNTTSEPTSAPVLYKIEAVIAEDGKKVDISGEAGSKSQDLVSEDGFILKADYAVTADTNVTFGIKESKKITKRTLTPFFHAETPEFADADVAFQWQYTGEDGSLVELESDPRDGSLLLEKDTPQKLQCIITVTGNDNSMVVITIRNISLSAEDKGFSFFG